MSTGYIPGADMERFLKDQLTFVGFTDDDVANIRRTGHLVLAKEAELTTALYDHFLSMPDSARGCACAAAAAPGRACRPG